MLGSPCCRSPAPAQPMCNNNHPLSKMVVGDLCKVDGHSYAGGFVCDICRRSINDSHAPVEHCSTCRYDLCYNCYSQRERPAPTGVFCSANHPLRQMILAEVVVTDGHGYKSGFCCNGCRQSHNDDHATVWHCSSCHYDLCCNCYSSRNRSPCQPAYPQPPCQPMYPPQPMYPSQPCPCPPPAYQSFQWVPTNGNCIPPNAVVGGRDVDGTDLYVARAMHNGSMIPGKGHPKHGCCYVSFGGREVPVRSYEVLTAAPGCFPRWQTVMPGTPIQGTQAGHDVGGQPLYVARMYFNGTMCLGKAGQHLGGIAMPFGGKENHITGQVFETLFF
eukprot:m51a1_g11960 hypothetical protein (330) ;mRNA; r:794768-796064